MDSKTRAKLCQTRRWRIRKKVFGSSARPRMSVRFTGQHIYVQFIDDDARTTLAAASTRPAKKPASPGKDRMGANKAGAAKLGVIAAQLALTKGISNVVFDRSGAQYHGKVKALADAAREAGLKF